MIRSRIEYFYDMDQNCVQLSTCSHFHANRLSFVPEHIFKQRHTLIGKWPILLRMMFGHARCQDNVLQEYE